jgi:L-ascorbate metabolism protein UlaG (beta-lactamase superfamily)
MIKATFLGHSCFLFEFESHRVLVDPFVTGNPVCPVKADTLNPTAILVSHGHGDHLGDAIPISKRTGAPVIAGYELASFCGSQGAKAHGMGIGGGHDFEFGRVKLIPAWHGGALESNGQAVYGGTPSGFVIHMGGKSIYHAGDTGLFGDMELIARLHKPDLACLPIGDNYTMGPDDAVEAVRMIKPGKVVPMHYNTFDLIRQDAEAFSRRVERLSECVILAPGESFEL